MATYRSRDITARRRKATAPRNTKTEACMKQATKEIFCLPKRNMTNNLGITAVTQEHSKKEKMLRKKYMGVWRRESAQVMLTMTTLPARAARYASRCTRKRTFPRCWTAGNPSKMNPCAIVPLLISMGISSTEQFYWLNYNVDISVGTSDLEEHKIKLFIQ